MQPHHTTPSQNAYIGTSNITLPGAKATFPEAFRNSSRLTYYGFLFSSLEVNSSFYKIPRATTLLQWTREVPENFQFTIKMNREITHVAELAYDKAVLTNFMDTIAAVGMHKGCLLLQFPGKITVDYHAALTQLLEDVHALDPSGQWKKCIEFRHNSWYQQATIQMLNKYGISMVLHDMPGSINQQLRTTAPFAYVRFHGQQGDYRGSYPLAILEKHAVQISTWLKDGKDVYVYFNNTMGDAFANAQTLQSLIKK